MPHAPCQIHHVPCPYCALTTVSNRWPRGAHTLKWEVLSQHECAGSRAAVPYMQCVGDKAAVPGIHEVPKVTDAAMAANKRFPCTASAIASWRQSVTYMRLDVS